MTKKLLFIGGGSMKIKLSFERELYLISNRSKYEIGKFEGKSSDSYRTQFYSIFGWGDGRYIKNEKSLLKSWFDQISLDGNKVQLCINRSHNIQLKENKYLKQLLREKYIKIVRETLTNKTGTSYLVKV